MRCSALLAIVVLACGAPSEPELQVLTPGSYSFTYQDTGSAGQGVWWYRGTLEVFAVTLGSVTLEFDVTREDLPRIYLQTERESYPFLPNTTHGRPSYFLAPSIKEDGCGGQCLLGQLVIHLAIIADDSGNFCAFGTNPASSDATSCTIRAVR